MPRAPRSPRTRRNYELGKITEGVELVADVGGRSETALCRSPILTRKTRSQLRVSKKTLISSNIKQSRKKLTRQLFKKTDENLSNSKSNNDDTVQELSVSKDSESNISKSSDDDWEEGNYEVECLLDRRKVGREVYYLVRWDGWSPDHDRWTRRKDIDQSIVRKFENQLRKLNRSPSLSTSMDADISRISSSSKSRSTTPTSSLCLKEARSLDVSKAVYEAQINNSSSGSSFPPEWWRLTNEDETDRANDMFECTKLNIDLSEFEENDHVSLCSDGDRSFFELCMTPCRPLTLVANCYSSRNTRNSSKLSESELDKRDEQIAAEKQKQMRRKYAVSLKKKKDRDFSDLCLNFSTGSSAGNSTFETSTSSVDEMHSYLQEAIKLRESVSAVTGDDQESED